MENDLFKVILNQGAWAVLFVWLLIDTRKESKVREEKLQMVINKNQEVISELAEKFIPEFLFIVIVATYVVGIFLKRLESVKDKYITSILMLFAITAAILLNIINAEFKVALDVIVNGVLQGILCWGVAVGLNQTAKQLSKQE